MRFFITASFVFASFFGAHAASLQVSPLTIDVVAPGAASSITLRNSSDRLLHAQVRVVRWTQSGGQDVYTPTQDVAVSPPIARIDARGEYTVRVVRLASAPITSEEAYRLIIDELPDPNRARDGTISLLLRHSVPVFFSPSAVGTAAARWNVQSEKGQIIVTVANAGARRLRVAALKLTDRARSVSFGDGLVGYALAGSTVTWRRPINGAALTGPISISAQSDVAPLSAHATRP